MAPIIDNYLRIELPGWTSPRTLNDEQLFPILLEEWEYSPIIIHRVLHTHIPPGRETKIRADMSDEQFDAYTRLVDELGYHFVYVNTLGHCNRFEFYPDTKPEDILGEIYPIILYTSGPGLRRTREGVLSKRDEILPSLVWGADKKAYEWKNQIVNQLIQKVKIGIRSQFGGAK